jgi:hypothetical protein
MRKVSKPLAVKRFMESHPLASAFVLDAITRYAVRTLDAPDWEGNAIISQDLWRALAQQALETVADNKA